MVTKYHCYFFLQDDIHEEVTREDNGLTFQTLNRLTFSAQRELTSLSCFASNKALDERKGTHLKQTTTINVKFKPEILKPNGTTEIIHAIEGEVVTLTCNFKANPMVGANIKWYKNGHLLESNPQQEGMYKTVAENWDSKPPSLIPTLRNIGILLQKMKFSILFCTRL